MDDGISVHPTKTYQAIEYVLIGIVCQCDDVHASVAQLIHENESTLLVNSPQTDECSVLGSIGSLNRPCSVEAMKPANDSVDQFAIDHVCVYTVVHG